MRRLLAWIPRVLGAVLLVYILTSVAWRDSVTLANGEVRRGTIANAVLPSVWTETTTIEFEYDLHDPHATCTFTRDMLALDTEADQPVPIVNEGLIRIVKRSNVGLLALGSLLFFLCSHFGIVRWWLLLRGQGIDISFRTAHKLTFVGFFFNNVVPGATGGDVIKAIYASSHTEKRAEAFLTVLVDRIAGIIALAMIAAAVLLTRLDNPEYRQLALFIFGFLGALAVGSMLFFSRFVRKLVRYEQIVERLPGGRLLKRLDQAMFFYRYRKRELVVALLLSFANQIAVQGIFILFAHALHMTTRGGDPVPLTDYLVVLPAGWMVSAVPLLPGGWGLRESAFVYFFDQVGVGRAPALALSVLGGMLMMFWSLLGGLYVMTDRGELRKAREEAAGPASGDETA